MEENHIQNNGAEKRSGRFSKLYLSEIGIVGLSILTAVLLIVFVFQSYQVDGPSMDPSLKNSDRLIVWKLPVTWSHITGHPYVPNIGDIIIFNAPTLGKQLVKRVIALPGDRVIVNNGVVTVYDKAHPKGFQPDASLPYGKTTKIPYTNTQGQPIDEVMRQNQIFVCGDNRPVSEDSRLLGPIQLNQVIGKLVLRILPVNKATVY
ncbi:MAG: signal peptidase I [Candidatus Saccharibacteria bacterium]